MPLENELLISEEPPSYNSVLAAFTQKDAAKENWLEEENALLKNELELLREESANEIARLRKFNSHLSQKQIALKEHIRLLDEQLLYAKEREQETKTCLTTLNENYVLLQRKNERLLNWLDLLVIEEERSLRNLETTYLEAAASCAISLNEHPEVIALRSKMQELENNLQKQQGQISTEVEKQVSEKAQSIQENILELFNKLIHGDAFTKIVSNLEVKFATIIQQEQEAFSAEFAGKIPVPDPLTQQYLDEKTKKLVALEQIHSDEKTSQFYNTSYMVLWAKITGFISVFSQLVEKKAGTGEKLVDLSSSLIGGLIGSVPVIGPLLDTIASFSLKEVGGAVLEHFEEKRNQNVLTILRNPEHAKKVAELFARSLTFRYQAEIQTWDSETINRAATAYSNQVYELTLGNKIKECQTDEPEKKIEIFLGALKEISEKDICYEVIPEKNNGAGLRTPSPSPKSKLRMSEKSVETTVHEGIKTLRDKMGKTAYLTQHTTVQLKGVKRLNSDLQQVVVKQQEQIKQLQSEVVELKKDRKTHDEEIGSLKSQLSGLQTIVADWLTVPIDTLVKLPEKNSIKDKFKLFNRRGSEERGVKLSSSNGAQGPK
ncbi:hypothetical protein [Legionella cardiaca]|uniref:Substrate of the Dot/Icm secretion system n=1 Tax=Legionella cardiaca TaxID=1071983 RepID=A0ABY8AR69_9GAMM|nr:hypothetical protein [Legionella cardiaca]WED42716.1 hypothetical protein PXX05_12545 [Legionella cardiaca]